MVASSPDPQNAAPLLPGRRRERQEWLLLAAVLVVVGLFGAGSRVVEHRNVDAEQRHLLQVQAQALDDNLSQQMRGVAAALSSVRTDLPTWRAEELPQIVGRRLMALADALPGVRTMLLLDRAGRVLATNRPELQGVDFGGRAYFQQARAVSDPQRLTVSEPFVSSLGVYSINLVLTIVAPDGSFGGAVTATLEPAHFSSLLRGTLYADDVRATVIHGSGQALLREPPAGQVAGVRLDQPGTLFQRHREAGTPGTVLLGRTTLGGDLRLVAQRTVQPADLRMDSALVVAVSRNLEAMYAPWRRQTLASALLYALLVGATASGLSLMQRRQRAFAEREAGQAELRRNIAERLELALRGADLGLWDLDLRHDLATVNERWSAMLGLPHRAQVSGGEVWHARVHPDDQAQLDAERQAHLAGRSERFEAVYRCQHADGHWVWIQQRGQVLERDAAGAPLRMAGTHMDVTAEKEAQLARERSEQSLAITLNSIGDAVIATDPQGTVVRMNATAERLTGWPLPDAVGQPLARVLRLVHPLTREPVVDPVRQVIASGQIVGLANSTLLVARDGREYQIADSAAPIRAPGGEIVGAVLVFSDVTERHRVQEALRANELRLRSLLENLRSGVIVHGPDSQVLDANPSACALVGLTLDQMRGKVSIDPYWAFLEEDRSTMAHERFPVPQVLASGGPVKNLMLGVRRPDLPEPLWVLVNAYPVRSPQGQIEQIVVTFSDVTERKETEERLRDSEELKTAVLDSLNAHIAVLDAQGVIVAVNEGWRRFGLSNDAPASLLDPVGGSYFESCAAGSGLPADAEAAAALQGIRAVLAGAQDEFHLEYPCHTPTEQRWFRMSVTPLKGGRGGAVVSHLPITELRQAEETLLAAKSELQATLEAVPDLLFEVDLEGQVYSFHSPRRELLATEPENFLGRRVTEFLPSEASEVVLAALDEADEQGYSTGLRYPLPLPIGEHWFELSVARKAVQPGAPPRFIALVRDITERVKLDAERATLEQQLRDAQRMESIGTLAGGIAHDFNNILASILGNVAMARQDATAGQPVQGSLEQIQRAGARARNLVQQILAFSRRDRSAISTQPLAPIVEETLGLLRATLPAGVHVDMQLPDVPVLVETDATQMQQVLMNLCTNAWQALPERGGRISVGLERVAADDARVVRLSELRPGACAHLWVRDNGSGMDEATRSRVFDPFFTTKPVGRGTGLGLSVVHGIVRAHEGAIQIDSAPGQGSTFHLWFPSPEAPPAEAAVAAEAAELAALGAGQRVLYIDDDEVMTLMVERLLQRAGFGVTVATDASAALARLRAQPQAFDVVLTDYNMPEISGLEVVRQVRLIRADLPVVLTSGYLPEELQRDALDAGARALLQKENTFEELAGVLHRVLAQHAH